MKDVWVIERYRTIDVIEMVAYWIHKTHQGAVASALQMANEDRDRLYRGHYRDNGRCAMPRVDVYGNNITVYGVDEKPFIEYTIVQTEVGA